MSDTPRIRIAVVDDHALVVDGIAAGLASIPDLELVATAATVADARRILVIEDVDVVLLDIRLEDGNGLQALAERGWRDVPAVLVLSSFANAQYIAAAARFGASGYVLKTMPLLNLVQAIRAIAAGAKLFTDEQLAKPFVDLTGRERSVIRLAMQGFSNKEIGDRLGTSKKAVEAHLSAIFSRLDIHGGRVELSIRAAHEGWLDIEVPKRPRRRRGGSDPVDPGEEQGAKT